MPVRSQERTAVPDNAHEQGAAQLPVRLPQAPALPVPVLHAVAGAVHQGEQSAFFLLLLSFLLLSCSFGVEFYVGSPFIFIFFRCGSNSFHRVACYLT